MVYVLQVSVFVPPLPPVVSDAPEASVTVDGDVTLNWKNKKPEEGVAAAETFEVYSKRVKDPEGKDVENESVVMRASGIQANHILPDADPAEASQSWMAKYASGGLEKGATFVFQIQAMSKKRVKGELSPASEPIVVPKEIKTEEPVDLEVDFASKAKDATEEGGSGAKDEV